MPPERKTIGVLSALWCCVAAGGLALLAWHGAEAGVGSRATEWPAASALARPGDRPLLVMFVHPNCPCSRASIGELERVMDRCAGRLAATVVFVKPSGNADDWQRSALWRRAAAVAGVTLVADVGGVEAHRFDAATSGQALLFDDAGRLRFRGGITSARGHAGDNDGEDAVVDVVTHRADRAGSTPVYGCGLFDAPCVASGGQPCN